MKFIALIFILGWPQFATACELEPGSIIQRLAHEAPKRVINELWDGHECEEQLLDGLSSGKSHWLKLAVALKPYTDAWSNESLNVSLGFAMLKAPSRVLPLVGQHSFDESICFPWDFDDSPEGLMLTNKRLRQALPMFQNFLTTKFKLESQKCLNSLNLIITRNSELRPNN